MLSDFLGLVWGSAQEARLPGSAERYHEACCQLAGQVEYSSEGAERLWLHVRDVLADGLAPASSHTFRSGNGMTAVSSGVIDRIAGQATPTANAAQALSHQWPAKGAETWSDVDGRYCAALWDEATSHLCLLRDKSGHEPIYYLARKDFFAFSTSFKALRCLLDGDETQDELGIADYLAFTHFDVERTVVSEIRRLPAACHLDLDQQLAPKIERYWSLRNSKMQRFVSEQACYRKFRELIVEIVASEAGQASNPGLLLSGGLDSSAIGSAFFACKPPGTALNAFGSISVDAGDPGSTLGDETGYMKAFVEKYPSTRLVLEEAAGSWILGDIERSVREIGFPHQDPFHYKLRALGVAARTAGCDQLLTGMGGDDFASAKLPGFFAYLFFRGRWRALLHQSRRERGRLRPRGLAGLAVKQIARNSLRPYLDRVKRQLGGSPLCGYTARDLAIREPFSSRTQFLRRARESWNSFEPHVAKNQLTADSQMLECGGTAHVLEYLSALSRALKIRFSSPLWDARVVEFAATTPVEFRRACPNGRSLLRLAFVQDLPIAIAARKDKGAFCPDALTARLDPTRRQAAAAALSAAASGPINVYVDANALATTVSAADIARDDYEAQFRVFYPAFLATGLSSFLKARLEKSN